MPIDAVWCPRTRHVSICGGITQRRFQVDTRLAVDYFGWIRNNQAHVQSKGPGVGPVGVDERPWTPLSVLDDAELDELTRALSNATRRTILRLCHPDQNSAGVIPAEIDLALASVSEHLKVLRKTGLVDLERDGTRWLYTTNTTRLREVLTALARDLPTNPPSKEYTHALIR